jgi:hypothetical protein
VAGASEEPLLLPLVFLLLLLLLSLLLLLLSSEAGTIKVLALAAALRRIGDKGAKRLIWAANLRATRE